MEYGILFGLLLISKHVFMKLANQLDEGFIKQRVENYNKQEEYRQRQRSQQQNQNFNNQDDGNNYH